MEIIKIGSKGDDVRTLQMLLNKNGFNISNNGIFCDITESTVEKFQANNNLDVDGIVGEFTWDTLIEMAKLNRIDDTKYVLPVANYYQESFDKKNIVLHHTNGWTVKNGKPSMNHYNWWVSHFGEKNGRARVATAFSIDYAGNIYQHFDPSMWAYHLGLGKRRNFLDKQSIGIELCNEGYLTKDENGKFFWYSGKIAIPYNREDDEPVHVKEKWRDYSWFAPYSKEQVDSTAWLTKYLSKKYEIKMNIIEDCEYHPELLSGDFDGVYNHANVRDYPSSRPKWDLSPAFPFNEYKRKVEEL